MRKSVLGVLASVLAFCAIAETTKIDVDVSYSSPFSYIIIGTVTDTSYNPWSNDIYIGYSGATGYSRVKVAKITETTHYDDLLSISGLENYSNQNYFYMELVAADGSSRLAYSDFVNYSTIQSAIEGPSMVAWQVNSAHAIPEPTSGLLLLVGGALLGLRRKRRVA